MNDIVPPKRPLTPQRDISPPRPISVSDDLVKQPSRSNVNPGTLETVPSVLPSQDRTVSTSGGTGLDSSKRPKRRLRKVILGIVITLVLLGIGTVVAGYSWYQSQLGAVSPGSTVKVTFNIESGDSPRQIGSELKEQGLIKNELAFDWYIRINREAGGLQAGKHVLSPSMDVAGIVKSLKSAKAEVIQLTFLPGATLQQDKKVLETAGYDSDEIDAAFKKQYDHPVFKDKPVSSDIEGYIYGETYEFSASATLDQILTKTFDQMYKVVQDNNLIDGYQKQGLTLYEGITLASIIQREVATDADAAQVAQVFLLRYKQGMQLGSDVTYQYIADKTGVERDVNLDSPYNTRRYTGLPPGPIAAPGEGALKAVANPAEGDYVFFLSGDDDVTYFARTQAEHEANIQKHCQKKCQII